MPYPLDVDEVIKDLQVIDSGNQYYTVTFEAIVDIDLLDYVGDIDEFNMQMREEFLFVRDFIVLHYHVTEREDTPFWRQCKEMKIPETLQHRIDLFKESGRIFQKDNDVFAENSWSQVMLGQGLMPQEFHPIVNMMTDDELKRFLTSIKASVNNMVGQLPSHQQFIDSYCKAPQI